MNRELSAKEQQAWDKTVAKNDIKSYEKYLGSFPRGHYTVEAKSVLRKLKEAYEWQRIQKKIVYTDLIKFVRRFPRSPHLAEARKLIASMEEEEIWKHARHKNQLTAYRIYATKFPQGEHFEEACAKIEELEQRLTAKRHHGGHGEAHSPKPRKPKPHKPAPAKKETIIPENPSFDGEDLNFETEDITTQPQTGQPINENTEQTLNQVDALQFDESLEAEEDAKLEALQNTAEAAPTVGNTPIEIEAAQEAPISHEDFLLEEGEQEIWDEAVSTDLLSVYKMYLEWYPNGFYAHYARQIIYELEQ